MRLILKTLQCCKQDLPCSIHIVAIIWRSNDTICTCAWCILSYLPTICICVQWACQTDEFSAQGFDNVERDPTKCHNSILSANLDTNVAVAMYRFFIKICILFCFAVLWVISKGWSLWRNNPYFQWVFRLMPSGKNRPGAGDTLRSHFLIIIKRLGTFWISHLYLTGVAAA